MHKPKRYLKPLLLLSVAYLGYLLLFAKEPEEVDVFARYVGPNTDLMAYYDYLLPPLPKQPIEEDHEYQTTRMSFATANLREYDRYAHIPADIRKGLKSLTGCTKMVMEGEALDTIPIPRKIESLLTSKIDHLFCSHCSMQAPHYNKWPPKTPDGSPIADVSYFGMTESSAVLVYRVRWDLNRIPEEEAFYSILLMRLDGHRIADSWEFDSPIPVPNRYEVLALCPPVKYTKPHAHDSLVTYR